MKRTKAWQEHKRAWLKRVSAQVISNLDEVRRFVIEQQRRHAERCSREEWHDTWSTPEPVGEDGEPIYKVIGRKEPDARG